jgi:hypothetical protein
MFAMNTQPSANLIPPLTVGKLQNNIAQPYHFTINNLLCESWQRVKGTKATYWTAFLTYIFIYFSFIVIGLGGIYLFVGSLNPELESVKISSVAVKIIAAVATFPLPFGISLLAIQRSVNLPIKAKHIFVVYQYYGRLLGTIALIYLMTLMTGIITLFIFGSLGVVAAKMGLASSGIKIALLLGGTALVTIPMFFSFMFAPLLIIEKNFGVFQAIKTSFLGFRQHCFKITAVLLLMILIYIISAIPLLLGLIWTVPMLLNVMGILYRTLFGVEEKIVNRT